MPNILLRENPNAEDINAEGKRIESEARAKFSDGENVIKYLEDCLVEATSNPDLWAKISSIKTTIESEMAADLAKRAVSNSPVAEGKPAPSGSESPKSKEGQIIEEIDDAQKNAQKELATILTKESSESCDENGKIVVERAVQGVQRKGVITHVTKENEKEVEIYSRNLEAIYDKFAELGFNVKKEVIKLEEGVGHSFAIEMPKGHSGNKDPLTMTEKQIADVLNSLKSSVEREVFAEINGCLPIQTLKNFYTVMKSEFLKELNIPATEIRPSEHKTAFTAEQISEFLGNNKEKDRNSINIGRGGSGLGRGVINSH